MATTDRDFTQPAPIAELARLGELRWKDGHDIVVTVKDAGHGPAIDVREYVTRDAYSDNDFADAGKTVRVGKGRKDRFVKLREPYIGPTKTGFWVSVDVAEELAYAIGLAVAVAKDVKAPE